MAGGLDPSLTRSQPAQRTADVDVCVCTFRRTSLAFTLKGLAAQRLDGKTLRVVVADNDAAPSAKALAEATCRSEGLSLLYLHAPQRNISVARNACLDHVTAPFAAFVDDDEVPAPDWLTRLLERQVETGADVVLGRVEAVYGESAPAWMKRQDLHSIRAVVRADGSIDTGFTSNVLFRSDILQGRRFDPALGRSGGEDTLFFHNLHAAGAMIEEAPGAIVSEAVPAARATLKWLLTRSFRSGQTHALMLHSQGLARHRILLSAIAKAGWCAGVVLAQVILWRASWRRSAVRGALHVGVAARTLGKRELQLY